MNYANKISLNQYKKCKDYQLWTLVPKIFSPSEVQ